MINLRSVYESPILNSMAGQRREKINRLQRLLPEGAVADSRWLEARGYPRTLRKHYLDAGWLTSPARGLFARPGSSLHWQNIVFSLQTVMDYDVVVGGRTALELEGYAHYLRSEGAGEVHLYVEGKPPGWLAKVELGVLLVTHRSSRLFEDGSLRAELARFRRDTDAVASSAGSLMRHVWGSPEQSMLISCPERAVLELLDELPERESFHQADAIFESLSSLRPARVQALLGACRSVKVKRLFLWFAHRHHHAWLKRVDEETIDLGSGKRALAPGGKLDRRYQITVPEEMNGGL